MHVRKRRSDVPVAIMNPGTKLCIPSSMHRIYKSFSVNSKIQLDDAVPSNCTVVDGLHVCKGSNTLAWCVKPTMHLFQNQTKNQNQNYEG